MLLNFMFFLSLINLDGNKDQLSIYIDEIDQSIEYDSLNQTVIISISDTSTCFYYITDIKGAGRLIITDNRTEAIIVEGDYSNSLDTFKAYLNVQYEQTLKQELEVISYYYPIKNGQWKYYDKERLLLRTEIYKDGVLVSCIGCEY